MRVLSFKGKSCLILNSSNANRLADLAGDNTDKSARVTIRPKLAMFANRCS